MRTEGGDAAGWAVLHDAVAGLRAALGDRLVAVYAVGSLTHGGFAPDVSDVDGVVIVERCDASAAAAVEAVVEDVRARGGGALAERLSLFWGDWATFGAPGPEARLPPIVRRDLLDSGIALHGTAPPAGLLRPTQDDLVRETAAFAAQWLAREGIPDPDALLRAGRRATTKMVLFPVRFLATVEAGLAGSNDEAVAWYVAAGRPHAPLAAASLRWRTEPIDDPAAARRLLADLPALYDEALTALRARPR
ncbi:MAG TPA: hypothetical protein VI318_17400 [Baekduia sp.]